MWSSKKNVKETLRKVFICLCAEPHIPPLHCTYTVRLYNLITLGKGEGGRVEPERRLKGQQFTKVIRNTNMTDCISSL